MRVGVRKLRRDGQQGTLRVALSAEPILHRLELRLDVSLGPQSSAANPNSVCARRSGNTPPCFRGRLLRLGCDRGGGLCVIWWCGGRGRSGSCCLCLGDLDAGSHDWVLDDEGLVEPLGFVGAGVFRGSEHLKLLLVGLEADLAELLQDCLERLARAEDLRWVAEDTDVVLLGPHLDVVVALGGLQGVIDHGREYDVREGVALASAYSAFAEVS